MMVRIRAVRWKKGLNAKGLFGEGRKEKGAEREQ